MQYHQNLKTAWNIEKVPILSQCGGISHHQNAQKFTKVSLYHEIFGVQILMIATNKILLFWDENNFYI